MNKEVYKHIIKTYGRNLWQWVGFVAVIIRVLIIRVYIVIAMAQVTTAIASGDVAGAKKYTLYFFLAYVIGSIISTLGELLSNYTEQKQYEKLLTAFYQKLIGKDLSFYRDNQTGYLVSAFRQYLDSLLLLLRFMRGEALGVFISLLVPPIVLFFADQKVGLISIGIILVQYIYIIWASSMANKYRQMSHEAYRKLTAEVSDEITNIIAFKSGGFEDRARSKVAVMGKAETTAFQLRRRLSSLLDLPRNIITAVGISLAVYLVISRDNGVNPQSLGLIVLTITYMFQIVRNVGALPDLISEHDDLITKIFPTLKYLGDDHEKILDPVKPEKLKITKATINVEHVGFSYPSRSAKGTKIPVFTDLNIQVEGGEQIGVVGLSGAGKSTLANLLLRFDEVDSGSIKIDGIDIRKVKQSDLRQKIAYVPQEPLLFHTTIKENITYYNPDADDSEIILAAKAAHAHEFIEKLPDGYDTIVGERGIKLSGGQKQRVAIARAILKKAPIMIFDEATSALDSESEQIIQRALPEIIGKQTAIVVAHRLSTVAGLDRIIVMHDGKIVEVGSHKELLNLNGRYNSLWQKQTTEFAALP
ncbi:MAG TPA: ABC transporter ATP-binding protein [Patescibacteria group bacterium]